ncbi:MAG: 3-isopropylmalate dehydrogenase, partial [Candidatus Omnitrophica bacterium]|nr:3-isopropylmalate dehydrogenase [Candidatus Omnitrophota bacterium]
MSNYKIAVIGGDGTGPEVVEEGLKVLEAVAEKCNFTYETTSYDFGGARYLKTGEVLPASAIGELKTFDSIFLGAIGHPDVKPGILEKGILLKLRFDLDQYINLRPVELYDERFCPLKDKKPADINFTVVRENSEGLYKGLGEFQNKGTKDEVAIQISHNTRKGVERCIRYAFEYAKNHGRKKQLTLCGKTNVLTYAFDLWERTFYEVAKEYPEVTTDYAHVDATTMWFIKNPDWFDVIVTDNMFGDI